ncbi:MAG: glycine cleavage system aminomethyltransferase GcvT [Burkholderiaceae bacterium]|nr:glycine cleavage system aminomethyltransferase GcvT [Burkholderiaceae bacterium]
MHVSASGELRMKSIPLEKLHTELGAKFGPFAGYNMPIQYPMGLKGEHLHTRTHAGLFDVSHMGQLRITSPADPSGAQLRKELEAALPCDFEGWPNDIQRYSVLLNAQGGIEDDLMLVWRGTEVRMVVNAGNRDADLALLQKLAPGLKFEWVDAALIALQGPAAESVLAKMDPKAAQMTFMQAADLTLMGVTCFATRSGYTGEDGYEISIAAADAERIVREMMKDDRVKPIGLGARDTLRLEAGLPLHGNDISPTISPVEAGLGFAIAPSRRLPKTNADGTHTAPKKTGGFPGAAVVLKQLSEGAARKLVGMVSKEPVPIRAHARIVTVDGHEVGEVTSGTVSPSLGSPVMLALIQSAAINQPLFAIVRDKKLAVEITKLPFVPKRYKR